MPVRNHMRRYGWRLTCRNAGSVLLRSSGCNRPKARKGPHCPGTAWSAAASCPCRPPRFRPSSLKYVFRKKQNYSAQFTEFDNMGIQQFGRNPGARAYQLLFQTCKLGHYLHPLIELKGRPRPYPPFSAMDRRRLDEHETSCRQYPGDAHCR